MKASGSCIGPARVAQTSAEVGSEGAPFNLPRNLQVVNAMEAARPVVDTPPSTIPPPAVKEQRPPLTIATPVSVPVSTPLPIHEHAHGRVAKPPVTQPQPQPIYDSHLLDLESPRFIHHYQTAQSPTAYTVALGDTARARGVDEGTIHDRTRTTATVSDDTQRRRLEPDAHLVDRIVDRPLTDVERRAEKARRRTSLNQYIEQHLHYQQQQQQLHDHEQQQQPSVDAQDVNERHSSSMQPPSAD